MKTLNRHPKKLSRLYARKGYKTNLQIVVYIENSFLREPLCGVRGMWVLMIRSVKRCLKKSVGQASLTFDELSTILVKIEGVINARPITYAYDDSEGVSFPLTPSQLVYRRNISMILYY